jgi:hypothetical protein
MEDEEDIGKEAEKKKEDILFLPMNFNLLLDYFNNKSKMRECRTEIEKAMSIMDEITKQGRNRKLESEGTDNEFKLVNVEEELKNHDLIDIPEIMDKFKQLFMQKHASEATNNTTLRQDMKRMSAMDSFTGESRRNTRTMSANYNKSTTKVMPTHISTLNIKTRTINSDKSANNTITDDQMYFTNYLKAQVYSNRDPVEMTKKHYEKFKSIQLATEETRKKLRNTQTSYFNSTKYSSKGCVTDEKVSRHRSFVNNARCMNKTTKLPEIKRSDYVPGSIMKDLKVISDVNLGRSKLNTSDGKRNITIF